jgi:hypothetical protein
MDGGHNCTRRAASGWTLADGVSYAYRRFGSGIRLPLVCLQHFRGGLDNWDPLVTDGLAERGPVILLSETVRDHRNAVRDASE